MIVDTGARLSPEAASATAAFADSADCLGQRLSECVSGRELVERGYEVDVAWAAEFDTSQTVPQLVDGRYVAASATSGASA